MVLFDLLDFYRLTRKMPSFKETFDSSILVTAKIHFANQKYSETRRCLIPKNDPVFSELVQCLEKLFGNGFPLKLCSASLYYIDPKGERVMVSTDEELAIAFHLTDKELKIGVEELQSTDCTNLKVENPSMDSSETSVEPFHSQYSTPNQDSRQIDRVRRYRDGSHRHHHNNRHHPTSDIATLATSTPTLYKNKIVPKISSRWSNGSSGSGSGSGGLCVMSKTFTKKGANFTVNFMKDVKRRKNHAMKANYSCGDCCEVVEDTNNHSMEDDNNEIQVPSNACDLEDSWKRAKLLQVVLLMLNKLSVWLFPMINNR